MTVPRSRMAEEAAAAPAAVERLLDRNRAALMEFGRRMRDRRPALVVMCARGSSDHAATFGKYLIETLCATPVASFPPSVASVFGAAPARDAASRSLCIAVSQSGRSPDLLASVAVWKRQGAMTVAFVNDEASPLAAAVDLVLPLCAGHPVLEPIAQIQSFYPLAARLSAARALDPDAPAFLKKVTRTR